MIFSPALDVYLVERLVCRGGLDYVEVIPECEASGRSEISFPTGPAHEIRVILEG